MNSNNRNMITILGSGTSTGIPIIGCKCSVCTSSDKRDQRLRTSIFIETRKGTKILVDTTPDLRTQLLHNDIFSTNLVIITHEHADHLHGIDDLRPLGFKNNVTIPVHINPKIKDTLIRRFDYIFNYPQNLPHIGGGIPKLALASVELNKTIKIDGEEFYFFTYSHGRTESMGFVHEGFAYIVDCHELPEELIKTLANFKLKLLIIDCVQIKEHATHLNVEKCFNYIQKISPQSAGLIHMGHELSHIELEKMSKSRFGTHVFPLYDSQKLFY